MVVLKRKISALMPPVSAQSIGQWFDGYEQTMLLEAFLESGLCDLLAAGVKTAGEAAKVLNFEPAKTEIFLNALMAMELLDKGREGYGLSPLSRHYLDSASPFQIRELLTLRFSRTAALNQTLHRLTEEADAEDCGENRSVEEGRFTRVMAQSAISSGSVDRLVSLIRRDPALYQEGKILDLGCSHGYYTAALCSLNPRFKAVLFDLPGVLPHTAEYLAPFNFGSRLQLQPGDFYQEPLGQGYTLALALSVFYRPMAMVAPVFDKLYHALLPGGSLYLHHYYLSGRRDSPPQAARFYFTRRIFVPEFYVPTLDETVSFLRRSGFKSIKAYRSRRSGSTVLHASKPGGTEEVASFFPHRK